MSNRYFGATDVGRMRQNNEDAFFVQPVLGGAYLAACVIDGVGGYEGGEVAAQIAQQVLPDYLRIPSGDVPTMMQEAMIAANEKILAEKRKNATLADMACVATLVLTDEENNMFHYVHVGDTRLYLFRDGSLVKVSKDQSFVGFLEDSGRLQEAEAMNHPKRNEINKALGFEPQLKKDYFDSGSSPFLPGDTLLLCSDGLTDLVPAAAMTAMLSGAETLKQKTHSLIAAANEAGGKDNIAVVLVQHSRQPLKQRALKPKKKAAPKTPRQQKPAPVLPPAPEEGSHLQQKPEQAPARKSNNAMWALGGVCLLLAGAVVWLLYRQGKSGAVAGTGHQASGAATQLVMQLQAAGKDTITIADALVTQPVVLSDSVQLRQDTLHVKGNGLRLVAADGYEGAAIALAATNRHLFIQDVVLENFDAGIIAQAQTVRLRNVQFLNCVAPVQYGNTVPVNSPVDLVIKDSLFVHNDTLHQ